MILVRSNLGTCVRRIARVSRVRLQGVTVRAFSSVLKLHFKLIRPVSIYGVVETSSGRLDFRRIVFKRNCALDSSLQLRLSFSVPVEPPFFPQRWRWCVSQRRSGESCAPGKSQVGKPAAHPSAADGDVAYAAGASTTSTQRKSRRICTANGVEINV